MLPKSNFFLTNIKKGVGPRFNYFSTYYFLYLDLLRYVSYTFSVDIVFSVAIGTTGKISTEKMYYKNSCVKKLTLRLEIKQHDFHLLVLNAHIKTINIHFYR